MFLGKKNLFVLINSTQIGKIFDSKRPLPWYYGLPNFEWKEILRYYVVCDL